MADLEEALLRVRNGDELAFATIWESLGPSVYGLAKRVVRDPTLAEEIAQEVFVQVWRLAANFDPTRGSAKTWILTLAHRRAVDTVRREEAAGRREQKYDWSAGPDYDVVEEQAQTNQEHAHVHSCLARLTDLQRQSVMMAYYGGLTYRQVAGILEVNVKTVKTRIRDGLIRLRDCLTSSTSP